MSGFGSVKRTLGSVVSVASDLCGKEYHANWTACVVSLKTSSIFMCKYTLIRTSTQSITLLELLSVQVINSIALDTDSYPI
jgi:hypothetical protein